MGIKGYLIGPYESGLERDIQPWLLPEDAFETLENAYVWRGRIRKRLGTSFLNGDENNWRLRVSLGDTDANGDITVTVPGVIFKIGQRFTIGDEVFTVNALGSPATLLDTGSATLATFDTDPMVRQLIITGAAPTTTVYFYPAEPVMGLRLRENTTLNVEPTVAFDTQFAYQRSGGGWIQLDNGVAPAINKIWTGDNADFFWTTNYRGPNAYEQAFYVVNYVPADQIAYLVQGSSTWVNLRPQLNGGATRFLDSCKVLLPFKDRLVALNTLETDGGARTFENRARWSQNGDPTTAATSWLDDTPGRGGFVDAPVSQAIVSAEFVKDRLIVYFERSTWELAYTGDSTLPFRWSQINSELGAESTFSIVGFDAAALGIGDVGVHSCDGVNVRRIDEKIPDEVFKIHNGNDGPLRIYGIRDYYMELVYWTFPSAGNNPTFPNRVLLYNYRNSTWSFFSDSFTCFGYLQNDSDLTWANVGARFPTWAQWNEPWQSATSQSQFPFIIAGNQEGFTPLLDADRSSNAPGLQITDMTGTNTLTVIDHNLLPNDYIIVDDCHGITSLNGLVVQVLSVVDEDTIQIDTTFTGTYTGGGNITTIRPIDIWTKQFNPGTPIGQNFRSPYIDFLLASTSDGEISVNYYTDTTEDDSVQDEDLDGSLLGSNILYTRPEQPLGATPTGNVRLWHRYYVEVQSAFLQFRMFLNDSQIRDLSIAHSEFELDAMTIWASPSGRIVG